MKYTARFVSYYYDEWDTTLADTYDISVEAVTLSEAFKVAEEILSKKAQNHSSPGGTDFVSLTDENGVVYVLSNGQLVALPKKDYDKLPKSFCNTGETSFIVGEDQTPKMRFPKPK